jgi:hypothetical protein
VLLVAEGQRLFDSFTGVERERRQQQQSDRRRDSLEELSGSHKTSPQCRTGPALQLHAGFRISSRFTV